jgi:hypothetical protein
MTQNSKMRAPKVRPPVSVAEWYDCVPDKCALHLPESLSQDGWRAVGSTLNAVETATSWWVGDWWNAFKPNWGTRACSFQDSWDGPAYTTCRNAGAVCRAFDIARRRANLTFKHHAEVAAMAPANADVMLDWCEEPLATGGRSRSVRELGIERRSRFRWVRVERKTDHEIPLYPPSAVSAHPPAYALNKPVLSIMPKGEGEERYGGNADLQWYRRRVTELEKELEAADQRVATLTAENQRLRRQIAGENDSNDHAPAPTTPRLVH